MLGLSRKAVPWISWFCFCYVCPVCEAFTPPEVILGNPMVLRKMKRDDLRLTQEFMATYVYDSTFSSEIADYVLGCFATRACLAWFCDVLKAPAGSYQVSSMVSVQPLGSSFLELSAAWLSLATVHSLILEMAFLFLGCLAPTEQA
jgi:hypothetical protein